MVLDLRYRHCKFTVSGAHHWGKKALSAVRFWHIFINVYYNALILCVIVHCRLRDWRGPFGAYGVPCSIQLRAAQPQEMGPPICVEVYCTVNFNNLDFGRFFCWQRGTASQMNPGYPLSQSLICEACWVTSNSSKERGHAGLQCSPSASSAAWDFVLSVASGW